MYPYNRNTQLYHSRAKETQAEKPSLLAQDKRLEELLSLARTEAAETTRKFETLLDRAELSEAEQILRTMYLDGKKHLRLLQEVIFLIFGTTPQETKPAKPQKQKKPQKSLIPAPFWRSCCLLKWMIFHSIALCSLP
mgnify:CR=1 FL=1